MLKGVLLQTIQSIVGEINAVLYPFVAFLLKNSSFDYINDFICQIQRNRIKSPEIINCT